MTLGIPLSNPHISSFAEVRKKLPAVKVPLIEAPEIAYGRWSKLIGRAKPQWSNNEVPRYAPDSARSPKIPIGHGVISYRTLVEFQSRERRTLNARNLSVVAVELWRRSVFGGRLPMSSYRVTA